MGVSLVVWVGGVVIGDGVGALGFGVGSAVLVFVGSWGVGVVSVACSFWAVGCVRGLAGFGLVVGLVVLVR